MYVFCIILCFLHRSCFSFTCHMSSSFLPRSTVPIVQRVPNAALKASVWLRRGPRCASRTTGVAASLDGGQRGVYLWNLWPDDHIKIAESHSNQCIYNEVAHIHKYTPLAIVYIYKLSIHCIHQIPNHHHLVPNRTFPESSPPKRMGFTAKKKRNSELPAGGATKLDFQRHPRQTLGFLSSHWVQLLEWNSPCWMIKCEDIRNVTLKQIGFGLGGGYEMINLCYQSLL